MQAKITHLGGVENKCANISGPFPFEGLAINTFRMISTVLETYPGRRLLQSNWSDRMCAPTAALLRRSFQTRRRSRYDLEFRGVRGCCQVRSCCRNSRKLRGASPSRSSGSWSPETVSPVC